MRDRRIASARPGDLIHYLRTRPADESLLRASTSAPLEVRNHLELLALEGGLPSFQKWWHYFSIYFEELDTWVRNNSGKPIHLLEIGVQRGGSLALWRSFLGEKAVIFGVDNDPACAGRDSPHGTVRIGSQDDVHFLRAVVAEMGGIDFVIDDGSHVSRDVITSLKTLFPLLNVGGTYIVEDLHTSYWPSWGGGLRRRGSSMEVLKSLADNLHRPYFHSQSLGLMDESAGLISLKFVDSMCVMRKGLVSEPMLFQRNSD